MERLFSKKEVNKVFDHIPSRTLRSWIESGMVEWAGEKTDGRGTHRLFSIWNLYQIAIVAELAAVNFHLPQIKNLMERYFSVKNEDIASLGSIEENINKLLGIGTGIGRVIKRFPFFKIKLCNPDKANDLLSYLLSPLPIPDVSRFQAGILMKGIFKEDPVPSIIIIINLPEIVAKVRFFTDKAGLS